MDKNTNIWPKVITVDKSLIKTLSQSTYDSFPNALKELITNSYDALATEVKVDVDLKNERITISDNGSGMSESDYEFYLRIAGTKRNIEDFTSVKRKKIGKFGVGFLSVFPFFENYKIVTKKAGVEEEMHANIPCNLYFGDNQFINIGDIKIEGGTRISNQDVSAHFTTIILNGFTNVARDFLFPNRESQIGKYSIDNPKYFSPIKKLEWVLAEDLPLKFENPVFQNLFADKNNSLPFSVYFNSNELLRKVYADERILDQHTETYNSIGEIKFRYVITTDETPIHPNEGRFLKIRNLNVGVGNRENFIGKVKQGGYPRLQQLTGEIHILDGMNKDIKVSRDNFNYNPDYEKLKAFFASKMIHYSAKLQKESDDRKAEDEKTIRSLKNIKKVDSSPLLKEKTGKTASDDKSNISITSEKTVIISPEKQSADNIKKNEDIDVHKSSILNVAGHTFYVKTDDWDYNDSDFPACKLIDEKQLIINSKYPLFRGVKHTDVFIKMHLFLLLNYKDGLINNASYSSMAKQILEFYKEYYKTN
ncbi:ATP-binding protein [Allomuricauda sp. R78024]|uniref:ATP-binding protein n=1 Tax=Allomuricauda sp. R78024 TaxID=3093867 RepID=UPI0037C554AE